MSEYNGGIPGVVVDEGRAYAANTTDLGVWTSCPRCGYSTPGREPHAPYIGCIAALNEQIKKAEAEVERLIAHRRDIVEGRR
jgi:hypothetical protein